MLAVDPEQSKALQLLGLLADRERQDATAIASRGADVRAAHYIDSGQVHVRLGALDAAETAFREALCIDPANVEALRHLVCTLELLGKRADAARAWLSLGVALESYDGIEEAVPAYRQALAREPRCLDALIRLGSAHMMLGEPASAVRCLESAIAISPDHVTAHVMLGRALHQTGDAERGWSEVAWSCHPSRVKGWRSYEQPIWDGSSLEGRSILIWAMQEYGLGDAIQLVRFVKFLKARGAARVAVECPRALAPLVATIPAVDRVVSRLSPLPPFDVHAPMLWAPILAREARESVGEGVPYLRVDEKLAQSWRERLGPHDGATIGICWGTQSNRRDARLRSAPLEAFARLAQVPNARFISLQLGPHRDEAIVPPTGMRIENVLSEVSSITQTAALISALDLTITIDTMLAHLAGALGRPVWTLLPYNADWRWHVGPTSDLTSWYPTMRLFRRSRAEQWSDVLERVYQELDQASRTGEYLARSTCLISQER